jgi:hypothetical protein
VPILLDEFHPGTRQWLFDDFNAWLEGGGGHSSSEGGGGPASRSFLLLAGPGMGKSVFTAVLQTKLDMRQNRAGAQLVVVRGGEDGICSLRWLARCRWLVGLVPVPPPWCTSCHLAGHGARH